MAEYLTRKIFTALLVIAMIKITFKFNGKTYTGTTDNNGIAKVNVNKNVVKKLKAGGTYTVTISHLNDVIKSTVDIIY